MQFYKRLSMLLYLESRFMRTKWRLYEHRMAVRSEYLLVVEWYSWLNPLCLRLKSSIGIPICVGLRGSTLRRIGVTELSLWKNDRKCHEKFITHLYLETYFTCIIWTLMNKNYMNVNIIWIIWRTFDICL